LRFTRRRRRRRRSRRRKEGGHTGSLRVIEREMGVLEFTSKRGESTRDYDGPTAHEPIIKEIDEEVEIRMGLIDSDQSWLNPQAKEQPAYRISLVYTGLRREHSRPEEEKRMGRIAEESKGGKGRKDVEYLSEHDLTAQGVESVRNINVDKDTIRIVSLQRQILAR